MSDILKNKELKTALFWSVLEVIVKRVLDLIVKLILARLLFPEDFGIIGMATVFTSLIQVLNDSGMGNFLIQINKEELNKTYYYTAFWTSVGWALVLYTLMSFVLGPLIAQFYNVELLKSIIPILALSTIFSSLNTVSKAQLVREFRFKDLAFINNLSSIISGALAIFMAFSGFGVWALVINLVATYLISIPLFYRAANWMPKLIWKKNEFKKIFGFGAYTTSTDLLLSVSSNIDYLIIGKIVSAFSLGAYTLSYMLTSLVKSQIESMINRVLFPFYSKIQSDLGKVKNLYLLSIKFYAIVTYPVMLLLIILGEPVIIFAFGDKWIESILPAKILALAVLIDLCTSSFGLLFRSTGNPKYEMKIIFVINGLIYVPAVLIGVFMNGIIGVAYSILVTKIISVMIIQFILKIKFGISVRDLLIHLMPAWVSILVTLGIIYSIIKYMQLNLVVIIFLLFLIYYLVCSLFFTNEIKGFLNRHDIKK